GRAGVPRRPRPDHGRGARLDAPRARAAGLGPSRLGLHADRPRGAHVLPLPRPRPPALRRGAGGALRRRGAARLPAHGHDRGRGARAARSRGHAAGRLGPRLPQLPHGPQREHLAPRPRVPGAGAARTRRGAGGLLPRRRLEPDARLRARHGAGLREPARPRGARRRGTGRRVRRAPRGDRSGDRRPGPDGAGLLRRARPGRDGRPRAPGGDAVTGARTRALGAGVAGGLVAGAAVGAAEALAAWVHLHGPGELPALGWALVAYGAVGAVHGLSFGVIAALLGTDGFALAFAGEAAALAFL